MEERTASPVKQRGNEMQGRPSTSGAAPVDKARTRKRSLFGRLARPTLPSEPLPATERPPSSASARRSPIPPVSNALSSDLQTATASNSALRQGSPERSTSPRKDRRGHGRQSSSSTMPIAPPSSNKHGHAITNGGVQDGNKVDATPARGITRGGTQSSKTEAPTAWYNRGASLRSSFLGGSNARGRDRSASVASTASTPVSYQPLEFGQVLDGGVNAVPSSPLALRRSFSRRSIYSSQGEQSTSELGETKQEGSPAAQPRRRLFGRSGRNNGEKANPPSTPRRPGQDRISPPVEPQTVGSLRHKISQTMLGKGSDRGNNPAASRESLINTGEDGKPARRTMERAGSDFLAVPSSVARAEPSPTGAALPKRLSGWLLNMLGTETEGSPAKPNLKPADDEGDATLRHAQRRDDRARSPNLPRRGSTSSNIASNNIPRQTLETPRSRTTGLLGALATAGRGRADTTPVGMSSSSGTGAVPVASGVNAAKSGLDRALRYFIDNSDQSTDLGQGIWLLGVWHGPAVEQRSPAMVSSDLASNTAMASSRPSKDVREQTTSDQTVSSSQGHGDGSSMASNTHRTRETSPSIASASSQSSGTRGKEKGWTDSTTTADVAPVLVAEPLDTPSVTPIVAAGPSTAPTDTASYMAGQPIIPADRTVPFQIDFGSRIWCTYRSHFVPIARDGTISAQAEAVALLTAIQAETQEQQQQADHLEASTGTLVAVGTADRLSPAMGVSSGSLGSALGMRTPHKLPTTGSSPLSASPPVSGGNGGLGERMGIPNLWNRATAAAQAYGLAGRAGLTTDAGWGCMLRTGQSVLANALLNVHLGRDWRRTGKPPAVGRDTTVDLPMDWQAYRHRYATYVRLLSWFFDEPSLACPFGVHRMAREGKRLGKEVGEWFGPSTAAGAIKKLVDEFPACGIGCSTASDGVVYLDQVRQQAALPPSSTRHQAQPASQTWARPVLVLIGIRLGLDGVHPMYHDSVKATFSFPQSVGIAGGRPSSSYYFVGYQGNSLFYLDPHHVRPCIGFKHPPPTRSDDDEWWAQAYTDTELATFHTDKPRRMPMKSLDPSMLLGFLLQDEQDMVRFAEQVKLLPRAIFSVSESTPKWMMADVDGMSEERAIESVSEGSLDHCADLDEEEQLTEVVSPTSAGVDQRGVIANDSKTQPVEEHAGKRDVEAKPSLAFPTRPSVETYDVEPVGTGVDTPRSEGTFEFVDPRSAHDPPQRERNDVQQSPRPPSPLDEEPLQQHQMIAFPTAQSYDEDMGPMETKQGDSIHDIEPTDESILPSRQSTNALRRVPHSITDARLPSPRPASPDSDSDGDSAWEDLRGDRSRSTAFGNAGQPESHADAIVQRAEQAHASLVEGAEGRHEHAHDDEPLY